MRDVATRLLPTAMPAALALAMALAAPPPAWADTVVAARTIPARSVIAPSDLSTSPGEIAGAYGEIGDAVGMEARVSLYQGRPVMRADLRPPAIVERNGYVTLTYQSGALDIVTEGRAMERGGLGERVRVMNLGSRKIVLGRVIGPGAVDVSP